MAEGPTSDTDPAGRAVAHHLAEVAKLWERRDASAAGRGARLARRVAERATAPAEQRSRAASVHLVDALEALAGRVERQATWQGEDHALLGDVRSALAEAAARIDALEAEDRARTDALARALEAQAAHRARLDEVASGLAADLHRLAARHEAVVEATRAALATAGIDTSASSASTAATGPDTGTSLDSLASVAGDDLYRDLEREFRGSRDEVKGLLSAYLPDVAAVGGPVLDIGCGRGEWLEALSEAGIDAYGVDLNTTFAAENRERGLDVRVGDAIEHLGAVEPASLGAVTGFHLAEHLPLDVLVALIDRSLAALRPGGLLILETPNPTNVRVGAAQFWIDPTHERPLHPELMRFLLSQRGFDPVEVRGMHPARHFDADWAEALGVEADDDTVGADILDDLRNALAGPQDYAVIGRAPHGR